VPVEAQEAGFPHARQAVLVKRRVEKKKSGAVTQGARMFILSDEMLANPGSNALRAGRLVRGHWTVENNVHWLRDAVGREDHCRCRDANQACALALLRTALLAPVRAAGHESLTVAIEDFAENRQAAVTLVNYQRLMR
jgi:predicted transposase YbfD/YdcC